jgi:hypothetical protein
MHGKFDDGGSRLGLKQIQDIVNSTATQIGAEPESLPTYGLSQDFRRPHIEVDIAYHWIVKERGQVLEWRTTRDLDQLLYWVFSAATFGMACKFEVANRRAGQDFRRLLFARQLELLGSIRADWRTTRLRELQNVLSTSPFSDDGPPSLND